MKPDSDIKSLDAAEVMALLAPDGQLSQHLKGFEPRHQQAEMMQNIIEAFNENKIALIEAGTGTGKSLAYLIPAILWAHHHKERTVISTNTINLQEQLLHKDIPFLLKALGVELKATLVKGMGNYVCKRKLEEAIHEKQLMSPEETAEIDQIEAWNHSTAEGSRSTLPLVPSGGIWEKVGAEHDTCNRQQCPHYKECFYFKARNRAQDANLLIVNHHLLCTDLISRPLEEGSDSDGLLPNYTRVILDEAHNFEDVATDFFADRFSQLGIMRTLARLTAEKQGQDAGKFSLLKMLVHGSYPKQQPKEVENLLMKLRIDFPLMKQEITHQLQRTCDAFYNLVQVLQKSGEEQGPGETRLRLLSYHLTHPVWEKEVVPHAQLLIQKIDQFAASVTALNNELDRLKNERLDEKISGVRQDINGLTNRLIEANGILKNFLTPETPKNRVRWIEVVNYRGMPLISLQRADLDLSEDLRNYLFSRFPTTVLVSATLTTNHQFTFIRKRLGLQAEHYHEGKILEKVYDSPFDYKKQALLVIPSDMPNPSDPSFTREAVERIMMALQASRGNAFVLFTSYSMLQKCYEQLAPRLQALRFHPMKQGDTNRQALITKFKQTDRSVLFGTDSFWEGVDVAGEALRCVILVKLPFKVPSEPIIQARSELIQAQGGDPFMDYSLPHAIVKFKQGYGRLIRHKQDRGCIVCLDTRILTKNYGRLFLSSLPESPTLFDKTDLIQKRMEEFYRFPKR